MTQYTFKWWHAALAALGAVVLFFVVQYYANVKVFRYRLTMEIEADGKVHSASSIIEVKYLIGYDGLKNWNTQVRGVAPMIDLGAHGTIIAALSYNVADGNYILDIGCKKDHQCTRQGGSDRGVCVCVSSRGEVRHG